MSTSPRNTAPPVPALDLIEGIYAVGKTLPPASPARATITIGANTMKKSTYLQIETNEAADARLIRLGAEFERLRRQENELLSASPIDEPTLESFMAEIETLALQIEQMPVTTIEGVKVKARVVEWCLSEQDIATGGTLDARLSMAIAKDILRIG